MPNRFSPSTMSSPAVHYLRYTIFIFSYDHVSLDHMSRKFVPLGVSPISNAHLSFFFLEVLFYFGYERLFGKSADFDCFASPCHLYTFILPLLRGETTPNWLLAKLLCNHECQKTVLKLLSCRLLLHVDQSNK